MRPHLTALFLGLLLGTPASLVAQGRAAVGNTGTIPSTNTGRFTDPRAAQQPTDPGEFYLNAYNLCRESESLAQQKNFSKAIKKGRQAEKLLAGIVRDFPDWKPNMVAARRKILAENLAQYKKEAQSAEIPSGRQPGQALPKEVNIPLPGIADKPENVRIPNRNPRPGGTQQNADTRELYSALARAQEECRRMAEAYKELNSRFVDVQRQLKDAQNEQRVYKQRYEDLQRQVRAEREAGNKVVDSLSRQLAEMEQKYRHSEEARVKAEERVAELETTLAATQEELERVTRERDALRTENEQLRAIVELNSPEKTKALLDQNLTLADQLKSAQERIAMLEGMMAGTDDQNTVLNKQLEEARDEVNNLREEMSNVYDENRGYRRRISELSERLTNLEAELEAAASRPVVDPALAEENKVLREVIAKQRRTLDMQEEGRRLLVETYKQLKNQDPAMLSALQKLDDESSLDLTDAERRMIATVKKLPIPKHAPIKLNDKEEPKEQSTEQPQEQPKEQPAEQPQEQPREAVVEETVPEEPVSDTAGTDAVRQSLQLETLANLAAKAFTKGRYTAAEQLYRTLYEAQPDHVAGLVNLGTILLYRNKCEDSVEFFERATRLAPDIAISYYLAGTAYYRMDRMEEAERMFRRTVELDPANAEAFFYLANIEGISGRADIALKHFAAAVKLKPTLGDAHYNMARLYAEKNMIPEAARSYDHAIHAGSEPDAEFENYLRNHPDNNKAPSTDLVQETQPETEAEKLRAEDPEIQKLVDDAKSGGLDSNEVDTPTEGTEERESPGTGDNTALPEGVTPEQAAFLKLMADLSTEIEAAATPSPAGTRHETDKKLFKTVRVRTRAGGYSHRVKLRLKRPAPKVLRTRGKAKMGD